MKDYSDLIDMLEAGIDRDALKPTDPTKVLEARYLANQELQRIYAEETKRLKKEGQALKRFLAVS